MKGSAYRQYIRPIARPYCALVSTSGSDLLLKQCCPRVSAPPTSTLTARCFLWIWTVDDGVHKSWPVPRSPSESLRLSSSSFYTQSCYMIIYVICHVLSKVNQIILVLFHSFVAPVPALKFNHQHAKFMNTLHEHKYEIFEFIKSLELILLPVWQSLKFHPSVHDSMGFKSSAYDLILFLATFHTASQLFPANRFVENTLGDTKQPLTAWTHSVWGPAPLWKRLGVSC